MSLHPEDAERQLRRDAETGAAIVRIQQEVAALELTLDLGAVLMVMIERAQGLVGASGGVIDLVEGDDLVCYAAAGRSVRPVGGRLRLDRAEIGVSYVAVHEGRATLCEDVLTDSRINQDLARQIGARAMIVVPLRAANRVIGVIRMMADRPGAFSPRDFLNVQILVESFGATIRQHRIAAQWRASEAQYRLLFDHNPHPMWVTDLHTHALLAVNRAAVLHYGYSEPEFLALHISDLWLKEDVAQWERTLRDTEYMQKVIGLKRRHRRKDGSVIDVEISADLVDFNGVPARLVLINDVTQRLRAERELARASRAQRMLSACNEVQIRAVSEPVLLEEVCRITVEIGGYCTAWVALALDDEAKSIMPVAHAGGDAQLLKNLNMSWSEEGLAGRRRRPAHQAVYSGELVVVADLAQESAQEPWVALGLHHGYRAVVCLPLRNAERTFGVLGLYAKEPVHMGPDEAKLLQELANDLAFGIGSLRAQAEQRALQTAVFKVAAAVSASTGTEFFEQLVRNSAETLGAQAGLVARLLPGDVLAARTVAVVVAGATAGGFEFPLEGSPFARALHEGHAAEQGSRVERFAAAWVAGLPQARTCVWRRLDNSAGRPVGLIAMLFGEALKQSELMVSTLRIFAARAAAELERQEADARIRDQASLLDKAQDAIIVRNLEDRVMFWNRSAERLYGWTPEEAMGQAISGLLYEDLEVYQQAIHNVLALGEWSGEFTQHRKDGSTLTVEGHWTLVRDAYGNPESILAINTDITQRKVTELQIQKLAFFDPLTGLPNRIRLMDRLQHALMASTRSGRGGALLFIDLDNFKTLNDTLGHDKGDHLLQQVAQALPACVREVDTVARLGGDEFVVMLEQLSENPQEVAMLARGVAEKVLAVLNQPFDLAGYEHRGTCSIGIAPFTSTQESVGELLKHAELAMYQAKTAGRSTLRFFDPDMQEAVTARAALEGDLRQALAQNEFFLHWQPQVSSQGGVDGVEALVRWKHPQRGMVSPGLFIPLAEETGIILPLGRWVLETACTLLAAWGTQPQTAHLTMAVNVSFLQFRHPDFVDQVLAVLQATGANPHRLKLELTESLLVDDMDVTIAKMAALKAHGVGFSLDDFGTGYSSLYYLKRLPLDQLKIDQSFVRDLLTNANDAAIVRTIIALAQSLGFGVIAEGVENDAQKQFLAEHHCHAYQGYFFSRPLAAEQLKLFLEENAART